MRSYIVFLLLYAIKIASRLFCRVRLEWVTPAEDPWTDLRVLALLNHTSLFEPLLVGAAPRRLIWQIAAHGVIPVADKTMSRPIVGRFFRLVARHVVPVTRERDHTWADVLERLHDPRALIVILPEGRMKRRSGLDSKGNPMTIRGGIADILRSVPEGKLFMGYSEGLHHIHAPGDRFPRPFRKIWIGAEVIDIPAYRERLLGEHGEESFKRAVIEDFTRRRDLYCDRVQHRGDLEVQPGADDGSVGTDSPPGTVVTPTPGSTPDHEE